MAATESVSKKNKRKKKRMMIDTWSKRNMEQME